VTVGPILFLVRRLLTGSSAKERNFSDRQPRKEFFPIVSQGKKFFRSSAKERSFSDRQPRKEVFPIVSQGKKFFRSSAEERSFSDRQPRKEVFPVFNQGKKFFICIYVISSKRFCGALGSARRQF